MFGRVQFLSFMGCLAYLLCACSSPGVAKGMEFNSQTPAQNPKSISTLQSVQHVTPTPVQLETTVPDIVNLSAVQNNVTPEMAATILIANTQTSVRLTPLPEVAICSPLDNFPIEKLPKIVSDPYRPPPPGSDNRHQGVDFVYHRLAGVEIPIIGVQVNSVLPGYVAAALSDTFPYGNVVIVETPGVWLPSDLLEALGMSSDQSLYLLYAHLQEAPLVMMTDAVVRCQPIGKVGHSGNTEAAHLHFETRIGPSGTVFPSMYGLLPDSPEEARRNYTLWRTSGIFQHFDPMFLLMGLE
ncbi:MAG TPA: M23 family metallopeptidase [Anaerolineales bacterium]|nr:M23 family metallopeptidase [Anaerolineales bacterium]